MATYYNEIDPYAAAWLRRLAANGFIPPGDVDERSIVDVSPDDLRGYAQCHFFAGIGGWAYAARLAGWPDNRPFWTGSCPCQPFSVAGRHRGVDDERHLWLDFFRLIRASRPSVVMGEQVARRAGYRWFDGVRFDLEGEGYACRGVDLPACAVDAPHERGRIYWCAVEYAESVRWREGRPQYELWSRGNPASGADVRRNGTFWSDAEWVGCADGKARRAEPGTPLLAHGIPARIPKWRGFGNAIVPQLAAEVISAFMECEPL